MPCGGPLPLTFQHRAGVSLYTSTSVSAQTCVFAKQSLGPLHCGPRQLRTRGPTPPRAILLPKLRIEFAEFLDCGSLARLRILSSPTCVGLRYGHSIALAELFLEAWHQRLIRFPEGSLPYSLGLKETRICLSLQPSHKNREDQLPASLSFHVTPSQITHVQEY